MNHPLISRAMLVGYDTELLAAICALIVVIVRERGEELTFY